MRLRIEFFEIMRSGAFEGRFATRIAQEMRRMSGRALSSRHSRNDFEVCDPTSALRLVVAQWLEPIQSRLLGTLEIDRRLQPKYTGSNCLAKVVIFLKPRPQGFW